MRISDWSSDVCSSDLLDRGDVPQGLAVLGEHVLVAAYREREGNQDCRIHRFAAATGAHAGSVDLPAPCSHAGGLAVAGGRLFLSDTWKLIELDAAALFDPARHAAAVIRTLSLPFPFRGPFAAGTGPGLRPEARRVGQGWVSPCRSWGAPDH